MSDDMQGCVQGDLALLHAGQIRSTSLGDKSELPSEKCATGKRQEGASTGRAEQSWEQVNRQLFLRYTPAYFR